MSDPKDQTRKERPRNPAPKAKREERDAIETAVTALDGERPEALAQFAQSARDGEESPKKPTADHETAPRRTSNTDKHEVATKILHDGAEGEHPDPHEEGVDKLPDRILDRG